MKKSILLVMLLFLVMPLAACAGKIQADSENSKNLKTVSNSPTEIQSKSDKQDQKHPKEESVSNYANYGAGLEQVQANGLLINGGPDTLTFDQLKQDGTVVKGTVIALFRMKNPENVAYTKTVVKVDQVISGNEALKDQVIYFAWAGGVTSSKSWYHYLDKNKYNENDHEIFVEYKENPLPKVGTQLVIPIQDSMAISMTGSVFQQAVMSNKFDLSKTYDASYPQYYLWSKYPGEKKFHLNNPLALAKRSSQPERYQNLINLTNDINHL